MELNVLYGETKQAIREPAHLCIVQLSMCSIRASVYVCVRACLCCTYVVEHRTKQYHKATLRSTCDQIRIAQAYKFIALVQFSLRFRHKRSYLLHTKKLWTSGRLSSLTRIKYYRHRFRCCCHHHRRRRCCHPFGFCVCGFCCVFTATRLHYIFSLSRSAG